MTDQEQKEWDIKLRKMDAEIAKIYSNINRHDAVIANLNAQTMKLATENRWYLLVVGAAFFAAATAFTKFFL